MNKHFLGILPLLFAASQMRAQDLPSQVKTHESRIEKLERLIAEQQQQIVSLRRQNEGRSTAQPGPAGPRGPAGPTGPRGEQGPSGTTSLPPGLTLTNSRLEIAKETEKRTASIGPTTLGGNAVFFTSAGQVAAAIGATRGDAGYALFNEAGKGRIRLGTTADGASATFLTDTRTTAAEIGVHKDGSGFVKVGDKTVGDFAEVFEIADRAGIVPGTVLASDAGAALVLTSRVCDSRVVGVVSGASGLRPGMIIGAREDGSTDLPVAVAGRVFVRANGEGGPIKAGDLLTSSGIPGVAMRVSDPRAAIGCTIGKAMSDLPEGGGDQMVLMLVFNR